MNVHIKMHTFVAHKTHPCVQRFVKMHFHWEFSECKTESPLVFIKPGRE